jgi:hypothetical protein
MDSMSAAPMRFRSPLGLSCRPALLLGQRMPVSLASWDRFASRRYLRGDSRCEALQLPQVRDQNSNRISISVARCARNPLQGVGICLKNQAAPSADLPSKLSKCFLYSSSHRSDWIL